MCLGTHYYHPYPCCCWMCRPYVPPPMPAIVYQPVPVAPAKGDFERGYEEGKKAALAAKPSLKKTKSSRW